MLRERLPDARIGFFLHIPFPSSEVFRILPWRRELLDGPARRRPGRLPHLRRTRATSRAPRCARPGLDASTRSRAAWTAAPCGSASFRWASTPSVRARWPRRRRCARARPRGCREARAAASCSSASIGSTTPRASRAGCSRSSGCSSATPSCASKVRLIQVAVPVARARSTPTQSFRQRGRRAGRAASTAQFGTLDWQCRSTTCTARVTPERARRALPRGRRDAGDAAARRHEPRRQGVRRRRAPTSDGVLVLSEFAGRRRASWARRCIVNPYDIDGMADAMRARPDDAPRTSGSARMRALRRRVRRHDVHALGRSSFLDDARRQRRVAAATPATRLPRAAELDERWSRIASARALRAAARLRRHARAVRAPTPSWPRPTQELLDLLRASRLDRHCDVHIVSGRPRDDARAAGSATLPIGLHAEHGLLACAQARQRGSALPR